MQIVQTTETKNTAATSSKKPVMELSDKPYESGFQHSPLFTQPFFCVSFHGPASGPVKDWPKVTPRPGILPEFVHDAVDYTSQKVGAGFEFVTGSALRVIDRGMDFAYDRTLGSPDVKLVLEKKDEKPGILTRAKDTVTGWFSSDDKAKPAAKGASLSVVKKEATTPASETVSVPVAAETTAQAAAVIEQAPVMVVAVDPAAVAVHDMIVAGEKLAQTQQEPQTVQQTVTESLSTAIEAVDACSAVVTEAVQQIETVLTGLDLNMPNESTTEQPVTETVETGTALSEVMGESATLLFNEKFDAIRQTIGFNPDWLGSDRLLDAMYNSEELAGSMGKPGFQLKCVDTIGRRVIVTATALGPVIVYQSEVDSNQLFFHAPQPLRKGGLLRSTGVTLRTDEVELVIGSVDGKKIPNIGKAIAMMVQHANTKT